MQGYAETLSVGGRAHFTICLTTLTKGKVL